MDGGISLEHLFTLFCLSIPFHIVEYINFSFILTFDRCTSTIFFYIHKNILENTLVTMSMQCEN